MRYYVNIEEIKFCFMNESKIIWFGFNKVKEVKLRVFFYVK